MKAVWCDIKANSDETVTVTAHLASKHKYKTRPVQFQLDFDCIPNLQYRLQKLWQPARERKQANLDRITKALGGES
jgi:hypothetical protein